MRSLLFLFTFFIALNSMGASYLPESKFDGKTHRDIPVFLNQERCKKHFGENCWPMPMGYNPSYHSLGDEMVDDFSKPIWATRSMVEPCNGEVDCQTKQAAKACTGKRIAYYNAEFTELWCNEITGYDKKASGRKVIIEDAAKKATHDSQVATILADEAAMKIAGEAIDCGKKVISRMLLQNKPKNLKKAQVRTLVKTYKDIKNLLETGSLESAREDILAVAADGVIVTEADKNALVSELDSCKP